MTTEPDEIRAQIDAVLAAVSVLAPGTAAAEKELSAAQLEELARQLSAAHDVLVQALESAEKG